MSEVSDSPARAELWPYLIAAMLCTMIAISLTFFGIAVSYPDAEVERGSDTHSQAVELHVPRVALDADVVPPLDQSP